MEFLESVARVFSGSERVRLLIKIEMTELAKLSHDSEQCTILGMEVIAESK